MSTELNTVVVCEKGAIYVPITTSHYLSQLFGTPIARPWLVLCPRCQLADWSCVSRSDANCIADAHDELCTSDHPAAESISRVDPATIKELLTKGQFL